VPATHSPSADAPRRMWVRRVLAGVLLLTAAFGAGPALPASSPVTLRVDALGSVPSGGDFKGKRLSDVLDPGYGVKADALYAFGDEFDLGAGVGVIVSPYQVTAGGSTFDADLTAIPAYALVQLHTRRTRRLGWYGEGGLGVTAFSSQVRGLSGQSNASSQTTFTWLAGAGAIWPITDAWDGAVGAQLHTSVTGDGEVWSSGDGPTMVLATVGVRLHH
jgi:hypothetical protein